MRTDIITLRLAIALCATLLTAWSLQAIPAKPGPLTVTQPDGTPLTINRIGDERAHLTLSADGYLLATGADGLYYFATTAADGTLAPTAIRATDPESRTPQAEAFLKSLDPSRMMADQARRLESRRQIAAATATMGKPATMLTNSFPSTGQQKAIVILVQYKDVKFRLADPHDYFYRLLNENGFNDYGGTGCAHEYFLECSGGQFDPEFDLYGPVTLSQNQVYYGGNDANGNDLRPEQMVIEACQQLDATVDFSQYDRDGDGVIDNVFVFYAGQGEASYGSENTVWPHAFNVFSAGGATYKFDGKTLDHYACSNEWERQKPDGVGTFIHEFSHVMGLPDLYVTNYAVSTDTPAEWSVLDVGPYNNDGRTPPLYSAFERMSMGWLNPEQITTASDIIIKPISTNTAYYIQTAKDNEFFLFENRRQQSWDKYIPGEGMLVWHIDYNSRVWRQNTVNNSATHHYVDIEEADGPKRRTVGGQTTYYGSSTDTYPGAANHFRFTDDTTPSMKAWSGTGMNLPMTDISDDGRLIHLNVAGGSTDRPASTTPLEATGIHSAGFTARWTPVAGATGYLLIVEDETAEYTDYIETPATDRCAVSGLKPDTYYYYRLYTRTATGLSEVSDEIEVQTNNQPQSAIETLSPDTDPMTVTPGQGQITLAGPGQASVITLQGITIYRGPAATVALHPGLYLVTTPGGTQKVLVK